MIDWPAAVWAGNKILKTYSVRTYVCIYYTYHSYVHTYTTELLNCPSAFRVKMCQHTYMYLNYIYLTVK